MMLTVKEAQAIILGETAPLSSERVPLADLLGRVLSEDIRAPRALPALDNSAMDGYAVRAADVTEAGARLSVVHHLAAGDGGVYRVELGTAARIFTGAIMPAGADSVLIQENTVIDGDMIVAQRPVERGQNVRFAGSDIADGATVLRRGRCLSAGDISCLASLGFVDAPVIRPLRVTVLTTGDELVEPGTVNPRRGQIIEGNSVALTAAIRALGAECTRKSPIPDDPDQITCAIRDAAVGDVVVTTGGVSVGDHDHVRQCLRDICGDDLHFWKVAVKPGKPLIFGRAGGCLIFGCPGNPVSALVTFELFVRPALLRLAGHERCLPMTETAILSAALSAGGRREEYRRAALSLVDGHLMVDAARSQSSGALSSIAEADALIRVPVGAPARPAGSSVDIIRLDRRGPGGFQSPN